ncbi:glycosyltransferase family 2 protein [Fontibacillus sp. BL9]|uniref:glycosyltransferase family 2 protein n=1 Tax=Fontibacillus sp. BL9 TaxID=3389971 RepID=UPI0039793CB6
MAFVSIIILTKNRLELTKRCVESVLRHTPERYEFVFVDNGSDDGTPEYLKSLGNSNVICNERNLGFAGGVNQGLGVAKGNFILLLNNDTVVTPNWLGGLMACFERDGSIGIAGPQSYHVAPIQRVNDGGPGSLDELDEYAEHRKCLYAEKGFYAHKLTGFCMLMTTRVLERIGGFDERFYPGNYKDDDFSIRARVGGYRLWVAEDVYVHHEGHGTFRDLGFNYRASSLENAERFRKKWNVGRSAYEIDVFGYNPSEIVAKESYFDPSRHFMALKSGKVTS